MIVIGLVFLVGGLYQFNKRRLPDGAVRFRGTVVVVREQRSSTRRNRTLYGPVVAVGERRDRAADHRHRPDSAPDRRVGCVSGLCDWVV